MEISVGKESFCRPYWRWKLKLNYPTKKSGISASVDEFSPGGVSLNLINFKLPVMLPTIFVF
jgi:hypothetical protein